MSNGHTPALTGTTKDADFRRRRARHAAAVRNSLDNHIKQVVDAAPQLTPDQRDRLALIFQTGETGGPDGPMVA